MAYGDIKHTFKFNDCNLPVAVVRESTDGNHLLAVDVGGYEYKFNVDWIIDNDEQLRWLAEIYTRHLKAVHTRTEQDTKRTIKESLIKLLNLLGFTSLDFKVNF